MRRAPRFYGMATFAALFVCALIAAGCGDDDDDLDNDHLER